MNKRPLKYVGYSIVFEEVPDEVTLAISISGCPHRCKGCHSPYLWDYVGRDLQPDLNSLLDKYETLISCVCFMGGDQNQEELLELANAVKSRGIKTALYSGLNKIEYLDKVLPSFDYIKVGNYIEQVGGLDHQTTNQIMYMVSDHGNELKDITSRFWRKKL